MIEMVAAWVVSQGAPFGFGFLCGVMVGAIAAIFVSLIDD